MKRRSQSNNKRSQKMNKGSQIMNRGSQIMNNPITIFLITNIFPFTHNATQPQ
ncbi:hypothetical protein M153_3810002559 [Pseudoloma neurophilia]|uniref:Uncharacterized protein n=1 Tax=Pseudoloma neurophilia TaxID=146866 RepID=A0A0R0LYA6_9MICR|nr:hypothetical protein M153_3810002559 [Pseudoloma neurophilia]